MSMITTTSGHIITTEFYNKQLEYFGNLLTKNGGEVICAVKPKHKFDYSYIIKGFIPFTQEIYVNLIKANLKAKVEQLLPNTHIVLLKEFSQV